MEGIDFRVAGGRSAELRTTPFQRRARRVDDREDRAIVQQAVRRAKDGEREALRFLYLRYADHVYGYVASIVRDDHEAEDVTQQVFTKLMTVLPRYEPQAVPFSAWILRVARNVAVDHLRTRRPTPTAEPRPLTARGDQTAAEHGRSLRLALGELPNDQRTVVVMRHLVGLSPTEIAEHLGRTESSVHGLHHRARGTLRRLLTELESAPATLGRAGGRRRSRPRSAPQPDAVASCA
jgi:RNA polymerase sigma-70 factor (ECF subfamily)